MHLNTAFNNLFICSIAYLSNRFMYTNSYVLMFLCLKFILSVLRA